MALHKTEAVVLKAHNWSESSRTVEVFSRDFGRIALVDKGGRRLTARRGRLVPFARMELTFYKSERSATGYVSESDLLEVYSFDREGTVGRLAFASAACELLRYLLSDQEPHPTLFDYYLSYLRLIETASRQSLLGVFLAFFLRLMSHLGYHPSMDVCVGCGRPLTIEDEPGTPMMLSPERGGIVCSACQRAGEYYIPVSCENTRILAALQTSSLSEAAGRPIRYQEATCLLDVLVTFARYQTGAFSELKSLEFLARLGNSRPDKNESKR